MNHTHDCVDDNPETMNEKDESDHSGTTHYPEFQLHTVSTTTSTRPRPGGRVRLYSESQVFSHVGRRDDTEFQDAMTPTEEGGGDGAPFRSRSQSAPPALWAAKKYGRQLRRMSDEFDTWLDKGVKKPDVEVLGWRGYTWSAVVRPVGRTDKFCKMTEEPKRGISPGGIKQEVSRGWFSFLWSPKESEGRE